MAACAIAAAPGDIGGVARPSESASASEGLSESAEDRSAALAAGIAQSSCCAAALRRPSASSARRCADTTSRHCQPHQRLRDKWLAGQHGAHRLVFEAPFEGGVLPSDVSVAAGLTTHRAKFFLESVSCLSCARNGSDLHVVLARRKVSVPHLLGGAELHCRGGKFR